MRIALSSRLGAPIVVKHACACGSGINVFGICGLSCKHSGGCLPQHTAVNELIHCALVSGSVPAVWSQLLKIVVKMEKAGWYVLNSLVVEFTPPLGLYLLGHPCSI